MGNGSLKPKIGQTDQAIFKIKMQRDSLIKYNSLLNSLIENDLKMAKSNISDKQKASFYLRKKKRHTELLSKTLQQIDTLDQMVEAVQMKLVERDFLRSLETGNGLLKTLNKECSVEKVDKVMEEAQEQVEIQNEIGEAFGIDQDEEIEQELLRLEEQVKVPEQADVQEKPVKKLELPNVPSNEVEPPQKQPQKQPQLA